MRRARVRQVNFKLDKTTHHAPYVEDTLNKVRHTLIIKDIDIEELEVTSSFNGPYSLYALR